MPTSDPYKTPYEDSAAKKKREDPLADYFGGQPKAPPPAPEQQMAAAPALPQASANMAQASNTAQPAQQRRPGPTGFTNFNRVIAANKDVSSREAAAYGQRAQQNAQQARTSLDALRKRFGEGVAGGTVGGPEMGFAQQPADAAGLVGESTRATMGGGLNSDQMLANAQAGYTGPAGLAELEGSGDVYGSALGAEQNLNALGTEEGLQSLIQQQNMAGNQGTSQLSSALIGNAGRGDFNALRERFSPQTDADAAEKEAQGQAKSAGETSKANAAKWGTLAGETRAKEKAAADQALAKEKGAKEKAAQAAEDADLDKRFEDAMKHDLDDLMNSNFESFNTVMNPITQIAGQTGNRDPIQDWGTNTLTPKSGSQSGGGSRKIWWKPEHKAVFKQMDDSQWAELRNLPQSAQARWLDTRKDEIAQGKPHAPFDATKDYGKNAFYGWKL